MTRFLDRIGSRVLAPFSSARQGAQSGSLAPIGAWGRILIALGALPFVDRLAVRLAAALQPLYATPLPRWTLGAATAGAIVAFGVGVGLARRRGRSVAAAVAFGSAVGAFLWTSFPYSAWHVVPTVRVLLGLLWLILLAGALPRVRGGAVLDGVAGAAGHLARLPAWLVVGALVAVGVGVSASISYGVFGGTPVITDGHCYRYLAHALAGGSVHHPNPFGVGADAALIDLVRPALTGGRDALFIQHPPGCAVVLMLGLLVGAMPLVNPVLHGATVAATYRLGVRVGGEGVGRGAAAILAVSPLATGFAGTHMAHTVSALAGVLFALAMVRAGRRGWVGPVVAGACLGAGIAIRPWSMVLMAVPFVLAGVHRLARRPRPFAPRLLLVLLGASVPLAAWFAYNHAISGSPWTLGYSVLHGTGHDLGFGLRGFGSDHSPFTWWMGLEHTQYRLAVMPGVFAAWPVPILALAAFALWRTRRRPLRLLWAQFACLAAGYGMYFNRGDHVADLRFLLDAGPALAVLGAAAFGRARSRAGSRFRAAVIVGIAGFALVAGTFEGVRLAGHLVRPRAALDPALATLERQGEPAVLFVDRVAYEHGCPASADPTLASPVVVARASGVIDRAFAARFAGRDVYYAASRPSGHVLYRERGRGEILGEGLRIGREMAAKFHGRRNRGRLITAPFPWTTECDVRGKAAVTFGWLYDAPAGELVVDVDGVEAARFALRAADGFRARAGFVAVSATASGLRRITFRLVGPGQLAIVEPALIAADRIRRY